VTRTALEGGACDKATHVVRAMSVGAFDFYQEGSAEVGVGAGVAGAKSTARRESLNQAGEEARCSSASQSSASPPEGCGALLRVELEPIASGGESGGGGFKPHVVEGPSTDARVKVAVGCGDKNVRGPDDGLSAYLDGSSEPLTPVTVKKRWSEADAKNIVDYVSYPTPPGHHSIRVRVAECDSLEAAFDVDGDHPAMVSGVLPPETKTLSAGPAGRPDGLRLAVGAWGATTKYDDYGALIPQDQVKTLGVPVPANVGVLGPALSGGWVSRWFTLQADARLGFGSTTGSSYGITYNNGPNTGPSVGPLSADADVTAVYAGLRPGFRVPLSMASLSAGPGFAVQSESFTFRHLGDSSFGAVMLPIWAQLDIAPLCDWIATAYGSFDALIAGDKGVHSGLAFIIGAGYQPNHVCRQERAGMFELARRAE
jgi:hypothetical protein